MAPTAPLAIRLVIKIQTVPLPGVFDACPPSEASLFWNVCNITVGVGSHREASRPSSSAMVDLEARDPVKSMRRVSLKPMQYAMCLVVPEALAPLRGASPIWPQHGTPEARPSAKTCGRLDGMDCRIVGNSLGGLGPSRSRCANILRFFAVRAVPTKTPEKDRGFFICVLIIPFPLPYDGQSPPRS
jgi:hypothetical protein